MKHWIYDSVFYHIYPLGLCGSEFNNAFSEKTVHNIEKLYEWTEHLKYLGINAVYFGPVFESASHGYDTADYYNIDRRLGSNESFTNVVKHFRQNRIRIILDGVFNHVGRSFWAFRDVIAKREESKFCSWFHNLKFEGKSPYNDPFTYEGWNGHYSLVKLNLHNPDVKNHLFGAVEMWIRNFGIEGLRLDTADCLDADFMSELSAFCKNIKPDFWIMGEVIHGNYRNWANSKMLDSVTNYECYKGLYSSHVDKNYFEIAYSLKRQFGNEGIYKDLMLYNFADNHDVNRVASSLTKKEHLYPLYYILFTMPGIPSVYYGSEWGIEGEKGKTDDWALRPAILLHKLNDKSPLPELVGTIHSLAELRKNSKALKYGTYSQLLVKHEQFAFMRCYEGEKIITVVNASSQHTSVELNINEDFNGTATNLQTAKNYHIQNGKIKIEGILPNSGMILRIDAAV